jgi:hypothetical protein
MSFLGSNRGTRKWLFTALVLSGTLAHASAASAATKWSESYNPCSGIQVDDAICRSFDEGFNENVNFFFFDQNTGFEHLLRITVDEVLRPFDITVQVNRLPADHEFPGFPGFNCVPYADPGLGGPCIEYEILDPPVEGLDYTGDVTWLIAWEQPIGIDPIPEIIHERTFNDPNGPDDTEIYDELLQGIFFSADLGPRDFNCRLPGVVVCNFEVTEDDNEGDGDEGEEGENERRKTKGKSGSNKGKGEGTKKQWFFSYNKGYLTDTNLFQNGGVDPVRAATSNNFSKVALVQASTPEPATLALFGAALGGLLINARRRRK